MNTNKIFKNHCSIFNLSTSDRDALAYTCQLTSCVHERKRMWSFCHCTLQRTCCHTVWCGRPHCRSNIRTSSATALETVALLCIQSGKYNQTWTRTLKYMHFWQTVNSDPLSLRTSSQVSQSLTSLAKLYIYSPHILADPRGHVGSPGLFGESRQLYPSVIQLA